MIVQLYSCRHHGLMETPRPSMSIPEGVEALICPWVTAVQDEDHIGICGEEVDGPVWARLEKDADL